MTELPWLDGYAGQTTDQLLALESSYRTDSLVVAFEAGLSAKASRGDRLSDAEWTVLAVEALERAVNMDGFDGLFRNESDLVPRLLTSLAAIGSNDVVELVARAISVLGVEGELTGSSIEAAIERDDERRDRGLDDLSEAYYAVAGDLAGPLLRFIRDRRSEVSLP